MENKTQLTFGQNVKRIRTNKKLSQEKFSLLIGMDRTYFSSVEAGKRNISLQNIIKIANGLNVPVSELFKGI